MTSMLTSSIILLRCGGKIMKISKEIENIGTVCYQENVLSGKKSLSVDGEKLTKVSKKEFEYTNAETVTRFTIEGNALQGVNVVVNGQKYEFLQKTAWYEYIVAFIGFVFILVWGNVPALCAIMPVVGGAIGGLIGALGAVLGIYMMRASNKPAIRLLIGFAGSVIAVVICILIGFAIVSAAK